MTTFGIGRNPVIAQVHGGGEAGVAPGLNVTGPDGIAGGSEIRIGQCTDRSRHVMAQSSVLIDIDGQIIHRYGNVSTSHHSPVDRCPLECVGTGGVPRYTGRYLSSDHIDDSADGSGSILKRCRATGDLDLVGR